MGLWKKVFKKLLLLTIVFVMVTKGVYVEASIERVVDINNAINYTSEDYYSKAKELVAKYPALLHLEVIGESRDEKPIYVVIMTENIAETIKREDFNVYREHYYVEAGNHSREIVNSAIVLGQIEDYCRDYYDDNVIRDFNLKNELNKAVIHFIPLVNPDGHDLVKFGRSSVKTESALHLLDSIKDKNYPRFKANIAGVDLNRNFPDEYYDVEQKQWVNKFQKHINGLHSYVPNGEFYSGPYGGSEPETQAIMKYVVKYDFRNFLSYHSMGNVIYYDKYWFSDDYRNRALRLANVLSKVNGYKPIDSSNGKGSGFFTDYTVAQTLKPTITVETTGVQTPTPQKYFKDTYDNNYLLPLYCVKDGREQGYFKYRLYDKEGNYVRDFNEFVYAEAHSLKLEGSVIVEGEGVPEITLIDSVAREVALKELLGIYYDLTRLRVNASDTFKDTESVIPTFARNRGILSSSDNFRPDDNITSFEVAVVIYNIHKLEGFKTIENKEYLKQELVAYIPTWAKEAVQYVTYYKIIPEKSFNQGLFDKKIIKEIKQQETNIKKLVEEIEEELGEEIEEELEEELGGRGVKRRK